MASGEATQAAASLVRDVRTTLSGVHPALVAVFASTAQPLEALDAMCHRRVSSGQRVSEPRRQGSSPSAAGRQGVRVCSLRWRVTTRSSLGSARGWKADAEGAIGRALEGLPREIHGYSHRTALLLLDPLAGNGEEATLLAASLLGDDVRLAGGAAGDDLAMKATCTWPWAHWTTSDAVVVALLFSKQPLGVGVCHGHEPLSPPLKVTRAVGGVVYEIDGLPAWQVWRAQTIDRAPNVSKKDEGAYLLKYEAGLAAGRSFKIRAPLSRGADDSISFACGIPEGSVIRITESRTRTMANRKRARGRAASQCAARRTQGRGGPGLRLHLPEPHPSEGLRACAPQHRGGAGWGPTGGIRDVRRDRSRRGRHERLPQYDQRRACVSRVTPMPSAKERTLTMLDEVVAGLCSCLGPREESRGRLLGRTGPGQFRCGSQPHLRPIVLKPPTMGSSEWPRASFGTVDPPS